MCIRDRFKVLEILSRCRECENAEKSIYVSKMASMMEVSSPAVSRMLKSMAVSYTHLDVYKRQDQYIGHGSGRGRFFTDGGDSGHRFLFRPRFGKLYFPEAGRTEYGRSFADGILWLFFGADCRRGTDAVSYTHLMKVKYRESVPEEIPPGRQPQKP